MTTEAGSRDALGFRRPPGAGGDTPSCLGGAWATQPLTREVGSAWLKLHGTGMGEGGPGS